MVRTLDELAELSGVSRATVSRVINGGPVAPATRRRVLEVLERTGFRPNAAARALASGRTGVVGVVMHVSPRLVFGDPYFSNLMQGMSDALAERAVGMTLWLGNRSKEETLDRILTMGLLDGVVVTANALEDPLVDGLLDSPLPTVLVGHRRSDRSASYVDIDNVRAAEAVTEHLLGLGFLRIGHVTGTPGTVAGEERLAGYLRAMERAGRATGGLVVPGDFQVSSGEEAVAALLDAGADAVFCANDATASGVLHALAERGCRVPDDMAVAGFDDIGSAAAQELTTMRQDVPQLGAEAARTLLRLVDDPDLGPRRVILPTELVIRRSTVGGVAAGRAV
jgi:LacI family transcriptional regulator